MAGQNMRVVLRFYLASVAAALAADAACAQSTIVLRDLTLVEYVDITAMNVAGLAAADGRHFSWDEILRGDVPGERQAEFDTWLRDVGEPLFRIRQRLATGDDATLQPWADRLAMVAEPLEPNGETLYLARCAQMRHLLNAGKRESAVLPLLGILALRQRNPAMSPLDEKTGLQFTESGICEELLPVWFDAVAAAETCKQLPASTPGECAAAIVYRTTLAIAAGKPWTAADVETVDDDWRTVYSAQSALFANNPGQVAVELNPAWHEGDADRHAIVLYYSGLAGKELALANTDSDGDRSWMLTLLEIPARYEDRFEELAAAAIFAVVEAPESGGEAGFEALRDELGTRYRHTFFGRQFRK